MRAAILALLLAALVAPALAQDDPTAQVEVQFVKPEAVLKMITDKATDFVLVDTQPEEAYEDERIVGAVNYPWVDHVKPPVPLPRDKTLILYCACAHDEDSIDMTKKLAEFGYLNSEVLEGGLFKWEDLKYPVEGTGTKK